MKSLKSVKNLIGTLCMVGLAACGSQAAEPTDLELGVDEAAACPTPAAYCSSIGLWSNQCAAKDYSQLTCFMGGHSAYFTVEAAIKRVTLQTNHSGWATTRYNISCPEFWTNPDWKQYSRVTSNKCRTYSTWNDGEFDYYYEQHQVGTSSCLGYVECYSETPFYP